MNQKSWQPLPRSGDVIIRHRAPKVWLLYAIAIDGDFTGMPGASCMTRPAAIMAAATLLKPGGRIYIHHQDNALWEEVPPTSAAPATS